MRLSRYYMLLIASVLGLSLGTVESAHSDGKLTPSLLVPRRRSNSVSCHEQHVAESFLEQPEVSVEDVEEEYDEEEGEYDVSASDETSSMATSSLPETCSVIIPAHELYGILLDARELAEGILSSLRYPIPETDQFASLASSYFRSNNYKFFVLLLKRFKFDQLENADPLWNLLHVCRNDEDFFKIVLISQTLCILKNFRSFWYEMIHIDQVQSDCEDRTQCKTLHKSFHWAFEHFRMTFDDKGHHYGILASLCVMNLLLDVEGPYPKSLIKAVVNLPGIELNVSLQGSCIALYTMGLPRLPEYYHKLILSDPRLDINRIVPATVRVHGHIVCHVPAMPLFMHSFIYLNSRALRILWFNPNLTVGHLIVPFFKLLRLAFLVFLFRFLDPRGRERRDIA